MHVLIVCEVVESARELEAWLLERWPDCEVTIVSSIARKELELSRLTALDLAIIGSRNSDSAEVVLSRQIRRFSDVPIVALSSMLDPVKMAMAMEAGADQYLPWSCPKSVFMAHVGALLRRFQSGFDLLTGFYNMRHFDTLMAGELERARRHKYPISLLQVEMDGLRSIEQAGDDSAVDAVLTDIARMLRNTIRSSDLVFRYALNKFLILLPLTDRAGADTVATRLRQRTEALAREDLRSQDTIKISMAIQTFEPSTEADVAAALTQAKC